MTPLRRLHWPMIAGLGALSLLRPLVQVSGLGALLGQPTGQIMVTLLISIISVATVVISRTDAAVLTLTLAGLVSGIVVVAVGLIAAPAMYGIGYNPMLNPFAITGVLVVNTLGGSILGLLAWLVLRAMRGATAAADAAARGDR